MAETDQYQMNRGRAVALAILAIDEAAVNNGPRAGITKELLAAKQFIRENWTKWPAGNRKR
jgi:predicted secreted acid phosphatase